jgi:hypothetical protein
MDMKGSGFGAGWMVRLVTRGLGVRQPGVLLKGLGRFSVGS